jgi:aspartyl-tRNA(Asn)/glutamyl-tRNA(Gln) amidotransferase subunit A
MSELTDLSAGELAKGYRAKEFSAVDATTAFLARIEKENPKLNAFLEVFDDALEGAKRADAMLAEAGAHQLTGVPIAIKDNILIKGKTASAASKMLEHHVATYDATVVTKLKQSGAVFLGRTNMDEFAMGSSTEHSAYGVTHNPHDLARVPGGTSGGSTAAVAAHLVPVALGSETCGSIRQPSSLCGVIGLKPTYGAVSRSGLIAMGSSLDQIGPISRTVADAELVFNAMRGRDPLDATSLPDYEPTEVKGKSIGVPRAFVKDAQAETQKVFEQALETLVGKGYRIVDIDLPTAPLALPVYYIIMPAEVSTNLARLDGVRYGLHVDGTNLLDDYKRSRAEGFGPETRRRIILGTYILSSGYYDAYYGKATALRASIAEDVNRALAEVSFIATPTAPGPAFKIGEKSDPVSMYLEDIFSAPANLTGVPSISVPAGMVKRDGTQLPVGIQFMSPKRTEASLFTIARDLLGEKEL